MTLSLGSTRVKKWQFFMPLVHRHDNAGPVEDVPVHVGTTNAWAKLARY